MRKYFLIVFLLFTTMGFTQLRTTKEGYVKIDKKPQETTMADTDSLTISRVDGIVRGISLADFKTLIPAGSGTSTDLNLSGDILTLTNPLTPGNEVDFSGYHNDARAASWLSTLYPNLDTDNTDDGDVTRAGSNTFSGTNTFTTAPSFNGGFGHQGVANLQNGDVVLPGNLTGVNQRTEITSGGDPSGQASIVFIPSGLERVLTATPTDITYNGTSLLGGGPADNLGNHIATQLLNMDSFGISGVNNISGISGNFTSDLTAVNFFGTYLRLTATDTEPSSTEGVLYADNSENRPKYNDGTSFRALAYFDEALNQGGNTLTSDFNLLHSSGNGFVSDNDTHTTEIRGGETGVDRTRVYVGDDLFIVDFEGNGVGTDYTLNSTGVPSLGTDLIDKEFADANYAGGSGATQLSGLTDVNTSTPTNRNVLIADGVDWESRAFLEADISDFGSYVSTTGSQTIAGSKTFTSQPIFDNVAPTINFPSGGTRGFLWTRDGSTGVFQLDLNDSTGDFRLFHTDGSGSTLTLPRTGAPSISGYTLAEQQAGGNDAIPLKEYVDTKIASDITGYGEGVSTTDNIVIWDYDVNSTEPTAGTGDTVLGINTPPADVETGTAIDMGKFTQIDDTAVDTATFTLTNIKEGGYAEILINTATEPSITGATQIPSTTAFAANTEMVLTLKTFGSTVKYFFTEW